MLEPVQSNPEPFELEGLKPGPSELEGLKPGPSEPEK